MAPQELSILAARPSVSSVKLSAAHSVHATLSHKPDELAVVKSLLASIFDSTNGFEYDIEFSECMRGGIEIVPRRS